MKHNPKIKALFFSQYIFQEIFKVHDELIYIYNNGPDTINIIREGGHKDGFLLLRDIKTLTDNEYLCIAKLCGKYIFKEGKYENATEKDLITQAKLYCVFEHKSPMFSNAVTNYLISIGIVRPFLYLDENNEPVIVPVKELIEWGWVKIKEM